MPTSQGFKPETISKVSKRADGAVLVPLTNSDRIVLVDDGWEEDVLRQKWHLNTNGYVRSVDNSGFPEVGQVYLHDLIMGKKPGFQVDHINGDRLDNRTKNLRHVTVKQQNMNTRVPSTNRSGCKGVSHYHDKEGDKWGAWIKINKHSKCLGYFRTFAEACAVRKKAEQELFGEYARKPSA